jgi:adenylate kinase
MIFARRAKDGTRARDADSVESIAQHQQMNRAAAAAMGVISGATVKIVPNLDGDLESAVAVFLEVFGK